MGFDGVQRGVRHVVARVEPELIHHLIGGEAEDEDIERLRHMPVVVDPLPGATSVV